jgi:hypothetical protein
MSDFDVTGVTEIEELDVSKVSGVGSPANGTKFMVLKATAKPADDEESDDDGTVDGKPDPSKPFGGKKAKPFTAKKESNTGGPGLTGQGDDESAESDDQEDEMTKDLYCGNAACGICRMRFGKDLSETDKKSMPESSFAFVDKKGGKHLPVHDAGHTQAAMGRFSSTDFSDAKGDPEKAKAKAAGKIKAAAGKFGMDVDSKSDVGVAAKSAEADSFEDQTTGGARAGSTAPLGDETPQEHGHLATGTSGVAGPSTGATRTTPKAGPDNVVDNANAGVSTVLGGGESAYDIPAEEKLTKGFAVATLAAFIDKVGEQRKLLKDGKYLFVTPPTSDAGDPMSLADIATHLANCCDALDRIQQNAAIAAASGAPADQCDVWDLQDASSALDFAMGVAARLSFAEAADGTAAKEAQTSPVEKLYRRLNVGDAKALQAAHDSLTSVLGVITASDAGTTSDEGDMIQMELTKSEFVASVQEILKADQKRAKKEAKKAARLAKDADTNPHDPHPPISAPPAGDNGKIDEELNGLSDTHVTKEGDEGVDGEAVKETLDPKDEVLKGVADGLQELTKQMGQLGELVEKVAKQPRSGGPVLDGQSRGGKFPATEARTTETVAKGEGDAELQRLQKAMDEATDPAIKSDISAQLTRERFYQAHLRGEI